MKIGRREVGSGRPTFIIAEIGSNHGGSLNQAIALIDAAAEAGADAAKFQYFRVDEFFVPRANPASLRDYELPDGWLPELKHRCDERGLAFLCTPFHIGALSVLAPFVAAWKIGSWEAPHRAFIDALYHVRGSVTLPVIASEGLAPAPYANVRLRCVSVYPAQLNGYLATHPDANYHWGVSDHTLNPTIIPAAAVALGACVVEKHMKLDTYGDSYSEGPDGAVSIYPYEFKKMVEAVRLTEAAVRG